MAGILMRIDSEGVLLPFGIKPSNPKLLSLTGRLNESPKKQALDKTRPSKNRNENTFK